MAILENRSDSWLNLLTGLGSWRDKVSHTQFSNQSHQLSYETLVALYLGDDMAARICDLLPNEMLRQGFQIQTKDPKCKTGISDALESIGFFNKLMDALIWSRVYGGAALFMGVDDGQDPALPIRLREIRSFRFLRVFNCQELREKRFYQDPLASNYGEVESYAVEHNREIHASRLLIFHGGRCIKKGSWPQSILQRIYPVLQQFHLAWQSTAHLMSDGAQGVFKLKGLHNAIASNKTGDILKRLEMVDMGRSVARSVLLDAEDEDFRRDTYSFSGVPQILEKMMLRLAAAAKIPVSLLMGQSPAGLHATGDSDIRFFYDQVRAEQEGIKPKMMHLIELLMRSKDGPTKGELFPFQITFPSLWQMTEKEKAELQKLHSETDCRYIQEGVLLPEEVAAMRFSGLVSLKDREVLKRAERSSYGE